MVEVVEDERARLLDLAAFAEGRLDPEERERIAEWLRSHPDSAPDIDAARVLASAARQETISETAVARACALVGAAMPSRQGAPRRLGSVVAFRAREGRGPVLATIAQWGSLAAALVVAGWLGFTLGMDTSGMLARGGGPGSDDGVAQDLFGSSPAFFRDLTGGPDMSMAGAASRQRGWPRFRLLWAGLAVSLVLNLLFIAGGVWSRVEQPASRGLDQRFERIGAQLSLDPAQLAAFNAFIAELRSRGDKVQQQVVPLYRAAWDAAGKPAINEAEVMRSFEAAFDERLRVNRETTARMLDFLAALSPEQRARFVALARDRANWRK